MPGRPHLDPRIRLAMGDSRGRWEGNTLVVDVTNFNDDTWVLGHGGIGEGQPAETATSGHGIVHSPELHVVERFTPVDGNIIHYEARIEDPKAFTRPFTVSFDAMVRARPDHQLFEYACHEGNRDGILMATGIDVEMQHHEVGTAGQAEIDFRFGTLLKTADNLMTFKYIVKNVAYAAGHTVTFMPKPLFQDNGSGMHCHQSLWKDGEPLFYDEVGYGGLSDLARHYVGGLLKHAPSLLAWTNPTTNSYRRLVPGYEAPVNLVYSARNRSACCRIPLTGNSPKAKRINDSVEITATKRYSHNWQFLASYVWSRLEGNYDGTFQNSTGQLDPNINSAFDYADFLVNNNGFLSNDRTHQFKFYGSYTFSNGMAKGLDLGTNEPAKAYYNRAVAYEGIDDEADAYQDYQEALVLQPGWDLPKQELLRFTVTRR